MDELSYASHRKLANGRTLDRRQFFADLAPHGTHRRYDEGCSCQPCRKAKRDYTNAKAAERKANPDAVRHRSRRNQHATSTTLDDLLKEW